MNTEPIRIVHSLKLLSGGGVERLRLSIFQRLRPPEFEHLLLCTEVTDRWVLDECSRLGVEVIELGPVRSILAPGRYLKARQILRSWRPDIVHGAIIEGYALGVVAGRLANVPHRILEETSDPVNRSTCATRLVGLLARSATVCIGVSAAVVAYLVDEAGAPRSTTRLLYNGVQVHREVRDDEVAALRRRVGLSSDSLVIGTVSRLDDDHKRVTDLLQAFVRYAPSEAWLIIVGEGPDRHLIEAAITELQVGDRVLLAGNQQDVALWYRLMDIFALASAREAFGLVNVEAMYAGLPVVATRVGGIPEIVLDGETGLLVEPRRPDELGKAIAMLAGDVDLRERLGESGRARAHKVFSVDQYVGQIERLYRELAAS